MKKIKLLLFVVLVTALTASFGLAAETSFHAKLSGGESNPAVKTKAKGKVRFKLSKDGKELSFKLTVKDIANVTAAHIHTGKKGENGPPVVGLFAGPKKEGTFSGTLAEGTITENDLIGDLQGKSLDTLIKLIKSGGTYVNVHTDANPDGEIRGQVK
jgi:hypothetical protein